MTSADARTWPPVVGSVGIWAAVLTMSAFTSFFQRSPIHSHSWWPLLSVWGTGLAVGAALLVLRRWAWAAAWLIGTVGAAVTLFGGEFILLLGYGS